MITNKYAIKKKYNNMNTNKSLEIDYKVIKSTQKIYIVKIKSVLTVNYKTFCIYLYQCYLLKKPNT